MTLSLLYAAQYRLQVDEADYSLSSLFQHRIDTHAMLALWQNVNWRRSVYIMSSNSLSLSAASPQFADSDYYNIHTAIDSCAIGERPRQLEVRSEQMAAIASNRICTLLSHFTRPAN